VRLGNLTIRVPFTDLIGRGAPAAVEPVPASIVAAQALSEPPSTRLDLRGMERADALDALDRFLDALVLHGLPQAEIVHGKGTGALRRAVQEHLAAHAEVLEARLGGHGEGGSGVTIVKLRA
jgi:DNA mismatch repair protein MutS2